ncbi:MAG TPA: DUF4235 domain-containing protein [Streptomyces sp.]|nr:DUF4235 domain-containing protein [Streptomyces sp.]
MIAGAAFKQAWKNAGSRRGRPDATVEDRTWQEALLAAILQGAVFPGAKAEGDRAGAP